MREKLILFLHHPQPTMPGVFGDDRFTAHTFLNQDTNMSTAGIKECSLSAMITQFVRGMVFSTTIYKTSTGKAYNKQMLQVRFQWKKNMLLVFFTSRYNLQHPNNTTSKLNYEFKTY